MYQKELSEGTVELERKDVVVDGEEIHVERADRHVAKHAFLLEHALADEGAAGDKENIILFAIVARLVVNMNMICAAAASRQSSPLARAKGAYRQCTSCRSFPAGKCRQCCAGSCPGGPTAGGTRSRRRAP